MPSPTIQSECTKAVYFRTWWPDRLRASTALQGNKYVTWKVLIRCPPFWKSNGGKARSRSYVYNAHDQPFLSPVATWFHCVVSISMELRSRGVWGPRSSYNGSPRHYSRKWETLNSTLSFAYLRHSCTLFFIAGCCCLHMEITAEISVLRGSCARVLLYFVGRQPLASL